MKIYKVVVPKYFNNGDEFASWIDQACKIKRGDLVEELREGSKDLIRYVEERGRCKLRKIPIISYPGGFGVFDEDGVEKVLQLNAWIAKPPFLSSEYIFLDSRLLMGITVFICSHSYGSFSTNIVKIVLSVLHSIFGYQEDPWEELASDVIRKGLKKPQYALLIQDAFKFMIAHEYGHFLLGHLSTSKLKPIHRLGNQRIAAFQTSRYQEFEADSYAYDLTIKSRDLRNYPEIRRAAELIFWCSHVAKQIIQGYCDVANLEKGYSDHPEPLERIENLRVNSQTFRSKCMERFGYDARLREVEESNENFLKLIQKGYTSDIMTYFFRNIGKIYYKQPRNLIDYLSNQKLKLLKNRDSSQ